MASVALSIGVMMASVCIMEGYRGEIHDKMIGFASHLQISAADNMDTYESEPVACSASWIDSLKQIPGVKHAQSYIYKPGIVRKNGEIEGIVMKGVDDRFDTSFFAGCLISGHLPQRLHDTNSSDEMMLSHTIARKLGLQVGMKAPVYFATGNLTARPFRICGIYETGLEEFDKTFGFCDIRQLRKVNRWDVSQVTGIEIYNTSDAVTAAVQQKILSEYIPPFWTVQSVYQLYPQIFEWLSLVDTNVYILLALMALVAVISMTTALVVLIIERTQMIGLLKSLGARDASLWGVFLFLAGRLLWRGMLIGNILSLGLCFLQQQYRFIHLDQESYYMKWVPIRFPIDQIIYINAGAVLICLLALLFPVVVISRTSPLKAIRFS